MNPYEESWLIENRHEALKQVKAAKRAREKAAHTYESALFRCVELGFTNVELARALGVSETAIRLYRKRNGER